MRIRILVIASLAGGLATGSGNATALPPIDVPGLVQGAELIVVGRATAANFDRGHESAATTETVSIVVDRVLKGQISGPLRVRLDLARPGYASVANRQYGVFFLRRAAGGGVFTSIDPFYPALDASPRGRSTTSPAGDALSRVTRELAEVLSTSPEILTNAYFGVQQLVSRVELTGQGLFPNARVKPRVLSGPLLQAQVVYNRAAEALETIPYETARGPLRVLATSDAVLTRLWAVGCLARMGDAEYLEAVKPFLLNPSPGITYTVEMFAYSIMGNVKSPDVVPTLSDLLASTDVEIRRAAAYVLKDIATPDVVKPLGMVALRDQDQEVRYRAVVGLSDATGVDNAPAAELFKQKEPQYLSFWTRWLAARNPG